MSAFYPPSLTAGEPTEFSLLSKEWLTSAIDVDEGAVRLTMLASTASGSRRPRCRALC